MDKQVIVIFYPSGREQYDISLIIKENDSFLKVYSLRTHYKTRQGHQMHFTIDVRVSYARAK
jgi:hypothetical protein